MLYEARYYGQTSSARLYTGSRQKSEFTKKPTVVDEFEYDPRIALLSDDPGAAP
jgi:hypothetical protein